MTIVTFIPRYRLPKRENKPSHHVSTSSDVSVKLEVEDRKPGPSQLFHSFNSDMQVDSPRSENIVDNGDDAIKSNQCDGYSEVGIWIALLLWMTLMTILTFRTVMIWVTKDTLHSEIEKLGLRNFSRYPHFPT